MSYPVAIPNLPDLPRLDCRFFDAGHASILEALGRTLPFVPVEHERAVWRCDQCGRTRTFQVEVRQTWNGYLEFAPQVLDGRSIVCNNIVYLRTFKTKGRHMGPRSWSYRDEDYEWNEQDYGPKAHIDPQAKFVRERPGPCPGSAWKWPNADVAHQQIAFLSILPLWLEAHRALNKGDQYEGDWMRGVSPFPVEWMEGGYATMVLHHRLTRLEKVLLEVVNKMNAAGHNLTFGGS